MRQTMYIDADDEISLVVERLEEIESPKVCIVAPKRALLLQSLVNLRLLMREAQRLGKEVSLVTQDEAGRALAEKVGFTSSASVDGEGGLGGEYNTRENEISYQEQENMQKDIPEGKVLSSKRSRLTEVGSEDFSSAATEEPSRVAVESSVTREAESFRNPAPRRVDMGPGGRAMQEVSRPVALTNNRKPAPRNRMNPDLDPHKAQVLERMFGATAPGAPLAPARTAHDFARTEKNHPEARVGGRAAKWVAWFLGGGTVALGLSLAAVFVPQADIVVQLDTKNEMVSLDAEAAQSPQAGQIPLKVLEAGDQFTVRAQSTGSSSASGGKSRGTVVIYNDYSPEPQSLVATTRLEAPDGKIFRLVKGVTVPGKSTANATPGAIEVEVIADRSGSGYDIEPAQFTIPGFKGGPKYAAFYAKSTKAMQGGSGEDSEIKAVSETDITNAYAEVEREAREKLLASLKNSLGEGEMLLEEAVSFEIGKPAADAKAGDLVESFAVTVFAKAAAGVFESKGIKEQLDKEVAAKSDSAKYALARLEDVQYATASFDLQNRTLKMRVHGKYTLVADFDKDKFLTESLGRSEEGIRTLLKEYPAVKGVNIEFQPSFIEKIPSRKGQVRLEVREGALK